MRFLHLSCWVPVLACGVGIGSVQAGQCRDPWVTQAVQQVTGRSPNGQGDSGECSIHRYGGGRWSNYNDLVGKVQIAFGKSSPIAAQTPAMGFRPGAQPIFDNRGGRLVGPDGGSLVGPDGSSFRR